MLSMLIAFLLPRTSWLASLVVVWLGFLVSSGFDNAGQAQSIEREGLGLPLLCTLGETCWVANYVDVDPTEAARDFRCRSRTYNTHDGTDFAIRDLAVMAQGVPVVASAAGIVRNVRDGVEDVGITHEAVGAQIAGRNCGKACSLSTRPAGRRSIATCVAAVSGSSPGSG